MELVLHSSAGWVQLVCTILWLPLWFLSLLFCSLFAFLCFSSRHFAFYGQTAFAISFPCLTQSMIRCVHSSRATIRSRNRSRSQQPEHFRWLATASAVAPSLSAPLLSPFCLSVCLCVVLCHQHTKPPSHAPAPFADGVVCFLFCTRFMSCGNWIVSGIEQWLLSPRPRPRPRHHPKMLSRNWCCSMCNEECPSPFSPGIPISFLCFLWFAYAVAKLVSSSLFSPLALVINLQKFFFMPKPVQGLVLLLLLVAAGDGQAAVIESIDAFATRIS